MIVAIDGPAGAGKGTVSLALAQKLGFQYIDTGALYRATALLCEERGVAWDDGEGAGHVAASVSPRFEVVKGVNRLFLRGAPGERDVSDAIRTPEMSTGASVVSAQPAVRAALLGVQRALGEANDVVMEGRDIGSVVFPNAAVKVYLTASVEERAKRRWKDEQAKGGTRTVAEVQASISGRDERDTMRKMAPLKRATGAHYLDATSLSIDQVVARIAEWVRAARSHA